MIITTSVRFNCKIKVSQFIHKYMEKYWKLKLRFSSFYFFVQIPSFIPQLKQNRGLFFFLKRLQIYLQKPRTSSFAPWNQDFLYLYKNFFF